jgi:transposase-like protein
VVQWRLWATTTSFANALTVAACGEVRIVSLLVAIAVNGEGYREIFGICEGAKEAWS